MKLTKTRLIDIIKEEMQQAEPVEDAGLLDENNAMANAFELYHNRHVKPIIDAANVITTEHQTLMRKIETLLDRIEKLEKLLPSQGGGESSDLDYGDTEYAEKPLP